MAAFASDWLRHFWLLLWNHWTEFNETWQETRSQRPLPSLCFLGRSKTRWPPWCLIDWDIFHFSSEAAERIQRNLTGSRFSTSSTKLIFYEQIGKTRLLPRPLIGWDIFDFSSELNSMKVDRKQDLNVLYQVCAFRADRKIKTALAADWLRHFRLLLWNRWTKFNETWQEARSQHPLTSLCFSGRLEKQDGCPGLWLAEKFSTSPMKLPNRIQRNLSGSNISTSSTKFVFFRPIGKKDGRPGHWLPRDFRLHLWTEFNETWQEAKSQDPLPSFYFSGSVNKNGRPGRFLEKVAHCTRVHAMLLFGPRVYFTLTRNAQ